MPALTGDYFQAAEGLAQGHGYRLRARTLAALTFPVPTLQPTTPGVPVALDLQPLGANPVESGGNGFSWVDCCDADVMHNNNEPVTCGRLGVMTINGKVAGYVGTVTYNGAPAGNFYFMTGTQPRWGVSYDPGHLFPYVDNAVSLGLFNRRITDVFMGGFGSLQAKIASLEARLLALENP